MSTHTQHTKQYPYRAVHALRAYIQMSSMFAWIRRNGGRIVYFLFLPSSPRLYLRLMVDGVQAPLGCLVTMTTPITYRRGMSLSPPRALHHTLPSPGPLRKVSLLQWLVTSRDQQRRTREGQVSDPNGLQGEREGGGGKREEEDERGR